jgi:hypothetical protein
MPIMKSQSVTGEAIAERTPLKGLAGSRFPRNPWVGDPPLIHAMSVVVENPRPNDLSKNCHRNIAPVAMRSTARSLLAAPEGTAICVEDAASSLVSAR